LFSSLPIKKFLFLKIKIVLFIFKNKISFLKIKNFIFKNEEKVLFLFLKINFKNHIGGVVYIEYISYGK